MSKTEHFTGHANGAAHRTTGERAWCNDCHEWCYPHAPCGDVRCCAKETGGGGGFDHRLTPEGRDGFLAAIDYIMLAASMTSGRIELETIAGLVRALRRKADSEYLVGRPSEEASA